MRLTTPHGFAWPAGLPDCSMCGRPPEASIHVNPAKPPDAFGSLAVRNYAADMATPHLPDRMHAYVSRSWSLLNNVTCEACGSTMIAGNHPVGMPSYLSSQPLGGSPMTTAAVIETEDRVVLATKAFAGTDALAMLPPQLAGSFTERADARTGNVWVAGRYVEADKPNRNGAYWTTADLEIGQPSISHGPINWLHEERHVIGAIADSHLVMREAAGEEGVGNHVAVLGAVWPWLYPNETRVLQAASDSSRLYFSMECVSRAVSCLDDGCGHSQSYRDYMVEKAARCEHMKAGRPRRFEDPVFMGAGIIVPPVRPGWGKADATVLTAQAEQVVEQQAAAFDGLSDEDATTLVSQILSSAP